jgi:glycosyltransferase involved in cell wall biosynthesis
MSLGCPVACSNNSSIPEVVGDAGEYFDPANIESIRVAMEHVLNSAARRTELIDKGLIRCGQFSWKRCAEETLAIYKGLI